MRGGARRQHRAAYAPQTPLRTDRGDKRTPAGAEASPPETTTEGPPVERGRFPGTSEAARAGRADGEAAGVKAIWRLPNPRDARRNARPPPCRRAPEIGRRCTTHGTELRAWSLELRAWSLSADLSADLSAVALAEAEALAKAEALAEAEA